LTANSTSQLPHSFHTIYDALGRRVVRQDKKTGRTEFTYDGLDVLQDRVYKSDGTTSTTNYVNGLGVDDKLKITSDTTSKYFLTDHLGSTVDLADSNGNITESATYDSFGNKLSSNLTTRYQYTGREYDEYTGLMFYRARFYDPQIGRFINENPIGLEGGFNLYVYVVTNLYAL
jgi:RHS repeat-associated protein